MVLVLVFAVLAAGSNALSSVLQRKAALTAPDDEHGTGLIANQLRRPAWYAGIAGLTLGFLLQAAALSQGPLAVVEPVLVIELPFSLFAASLVFRVRLGRPEWAAVSLIALGLVAALAAADPRGGQPKASGLDWVLTLVAVGGALGVLTLVGLRSSGPRRAALLAVVAGSAFGLTATLIAAVTALATHRFTSIFFSWQLYAMIVTGILALLVLQQAFQAGTLASAQPGVTVADPIVSVVLGVTAICCGVIWLSGSALISGEADRQVKADARKHAA